VFSVGVILSTVLSTLSHRSVRVVPGALAVLDVGPCILIKSITVLESFVTESVPQNVEVARLVPAVGGWHIFSVFLTRNPRSWVGSFWRVSIATS
jgi:hypothetical protein